ncbi:POTE ankyrin domain family member 2 [Apodemus speciosus]|uniref:POTE ankyrin domain family member 2 n=1 Tax=Apodemus speciosus TaxID=105296 RepID=A0ABQ0EFV0_APOSI
MKNFYKMRQANSNEQENRKFTCPEDLNANQSETDESNILKQKIDLAAGRLNQVLFNSKELENKSQSLHQNVLAMTAIQEKSKMPEGREEKLKQELLILETHRSMNMIEHREAEIFKQEIEEKPRLQLEENVEGISVFLQLCLGKVNKVQSLLEQEKCNVDDRDGNNRTALHFASCYGMAEIVNILMENDCDINALDNQKTTPLIKAVQMCEENIVSLLLEHGADPNIKDVDGNTALHYAVYVGKPAIAAALLPYGANIEEKTEGWLQSSITGPQRKPASHGRILNKKRSRYTCVG